MLCTPLGSTSPRTTRLSMASTWSLTISLELSNPRMESVLPICFRGAVSSPRAGRSIVGARARRSNLSFTTASSSLSAIAALAIAWRPDIASVLFVVSRLTACLKPSDTSEEWARSAAASSSCSINSTLADRRSALSPSIARLFNSISTRRSSFTASASSAPSCWPRLSTNSPKACHCRSSAEPWVKRCNPDAIFLNVETASVLSSPLRMVRSTF